MNRRFLIISRHESDWLPHFSKALLPLGAVTVLTESELYLGKAGERTGGYDLFWIDSSYTHNVRGAVEYLKALHNNVPVIVVSVSPEWQSVRDAMLAGADDYVAKTLHEDDIREAAARMLGIYAGLKRAVLSNAT